MLVFKPCENLLLLLPPKIFTTTTTNSKPHLHLHLHHHHHDVKLHCSPLKPHFKSTLSSSPSPSDSSSSLTTAAAAAAAVDFLMDSCGLSYVEAIQVIRKKPTLLQNGGKKPRSVIAYFESLGFSKTTHISKLILKSPRVLVSDVEKTLQPKIQLFIDFGFSNSDIADLMSSIPTLLRTGVKTQMKPALELIKSFVKTDEDLIKTIKRNAYLLVIVSNIRRKSIEPNIDVLRHHGVPDSEILHLILTKPLSSLMSTPKVFQSIVKRIVILGFKPETRKFLAAVSVMCSMKKATWDSKIDLLKGGLGWSDEQILDAFIRHPIFLAFSGEKMKENIGFFESLNIDVSFLSQHPFILGYSLKARVMPRYAVFKCLMSKNIIKEDKKFIPTLNLPETEFLSKYVFKYQDQLPYLHEVYKKECMLGDVRKTMMIEITNQQDNGDIDMTV